MIYKKEIFDSLEGSIKLLTQALNEREGMRRALLCAWKVACVDDIDDLETYRAGADLEDQIDTIKDLLSEINFYIVRIGAFKE